PFISHAPPSAPPLPSFPTRRSSDLPPARETRAMEFVDAGPESAVPPSGGLRVMVDGRAVAVFRGPAGLVAFDDVCPHAGAPLSRSEEHTSELQSRVDIVCRLLLEKK